MKKMRVVVTALCIAVLALTSVHAQKPEDNPDIFGKSDDNTSYTVAKIRMSRPADMESYSIKAEGFITPSRDIRAGDDIKYIVRVSWKGRQDEIEVDEPGAPILSNLSLEKVAPSNSFSPETERAITEFRYHLEAREPGEAYIGMVDGDYRLTDGSGRGSFRLEKHRFEVLPAKRIWGRIFLTLLIIVLVLGAIAGLVYLVRYIIKHWPEKKPSLPDDIDSDVTTRYERILGEIASMKLFLIDGEIRDFYAKLTKLAKGFVAVTEGSEITKLTTDELLQKLKDKDYNPENRDRIFSILEICDRVKYAGYIPKSEENEQVLKDFESLVRAQLRK